MTTTMFDSETDEHIIDYPTDHGGLSDPARVRPIQAFVFGAEVIGYAETPFFDDLQRHQGDEAPLLVDGKVNAELRDRLFGAAPIEDVRIADLIFTQPDIDPEWIKTVAPTLSWRSLEAQPVEVVLEGTRPFLMDGHHRAVGWYVRGYDYVPARVISAEELAR